MVRRAEIKRYVHALAREFAPERVVLFGSYARGRPTADSDVDLLVVMKHRRDSTEQALEIRRRIWRSFPLDLIVRTPSVIRQRLAQNDMFLTSILHEGRILYEKKRPRVD